MIESFNYAQCFKLNGLDVVRLCAYSSAFGCGAALGMTRIFVTVAICGLSLASAAAPARAFDFFGLFGEPEKAQPKPDAVAYDIVFSGLDDNGAAERNVKDASNSWRLRLDSPAAGVGLTRRVVADYPKIAEALWASGYFNATVRASVAGVAISPEGQGADAAAAAAERYKGVGLVPVTFAIDPGPLFKLRHVVVYDARTNAPIDSALVSRKALNFDDDDPAAAAELRSREAEWVDALRDKSFPLAKVVSSRPVIYHREHVMDVAVTIDPGPKAGIGEVQLSGSPGVDPEVIRSFIYLEEGEPYSPKKLADTRKSVSRIEAIGGVKVEDGPALDKNGNLPILVETNERKVHALGAAAMFSNINGPSLRAYWMDRNLFGGAERLRFDLEGGLAYYANSSSFLAFPQLKASNLVGVAHVGFIKPALYGTRNDLLLDASLVRERTVYYWAAYGNFNGAIRHRFSDAASIQAGVEVEGGQFHDVYGLHDYSLLGFPVSGNYDSTRQRARADEGRARHGARRALREGPSARRQHGGVQGAGLDLLRAGRRRLVYSRRPGGGRFHHRRISPGRARQPPLLCRRWRLGARLPLPLHQPRERLRLPHRGPQSFRSLRRSAAEGDAEHRHCSLSRRRRGLFVSLARF